MTEHQDPYGPYTVEYSGIVERSMIEFVKSAAAHGLGTPAKDALRELNSLLEIYPEFGEPLVKFGTGGQRYLGCVADVFVDYVVFEERRLAWVVVPVKAMANSRFDFGG